MVCFIAKETFERKPERLQILRTPSNLVLAVKSKALGKLGNIMFAMMFLVCSRRETFFSETKFFFLGSKNVSKQIQKNFVENFPICAGLKTS